MTYGLIGFPLTHSFSRGYFTEKFAELGISDTHRYLNFEMEDIAGFCDLRKLHPDLHGCNVTIPHKESIIRYLDEVAPAAARIGAVNCIRFDENGRSTGFNTDYLAFQEDFLQQLRDYDWINKAFGLPTDDDLLETFLEETNALVLGTGGASLAVHEALRELGVTTMAVSRSPGPDRLTYAELTPEIIQDYHLIINTTPLGMYPKVDSCPDLPYSSMGMAHFCYDLVYNPEETLFLKQARANGAGGGNGMGMLHRQAEAGWEIWNEKTT